MATGFIYTVKSVIKNYEQKQFHNVPTYWEDRLFFGPCKGGMRLRMNPGDYIFGVSPSKLKPRRIVFAMKVAERITFAEAYHRFPELRGPEGPIHVQPVSRPGRPFPLCDYEHITGAMHDKKLKSRKEWENDLKMRDLDRFFTGMQQNGWFGGWLGRQGPAIDQDILHFLMTCSVYNGFGYHISSRNGDATLNNPIAYGQFNRGLHLETSDPEGLIVLCNERMAGIHLDSGIGNVEADITKHRRNRKSTCRSSC